MLSYLFDKGEECRDLTEADKIKKRGSKNTQRKVSVIP